MKKCKAYHLLCEQEDGKQMEVKVEMSFYFGTIFPPHCSLLLVWTYITKNNIRLEAGYISNVICIIYCVVASPA